MEAAFNKLRIHLDKDEAIKTNSGYIIMKEGKPMEVMNTQIEMLVLEPELVTNGELKVESPIDSLKRTLDLFSGTVGIKGISINWQTQNPII